MRLHDARVCGQRVVRVGDVVADPQRAGGKPAPAHGVEVGTQAIGFGPAEQARHHGISMLLVTPDQVGVEGCRKAHGLLHGELHARRRGANAAPSAPNTVAFRRRYWPIPSVRQESVAIRQTPIGPEPEAPPAAPASARRQHKSPEG